MNRESNFTQFAFTELLPFHSIPTHEYFTGKNNVQIAYRHLIHAKSADMKIDYFSEWSC